jgi:hypothetical protein
VQLRFLTVRYFAYAAGGLGLILLLAAFQSSFPWGVMATRPSQGTRPTLVACAVSGVLCGVISSVSRDTGFILTQPIYYAAGLIFGYCFARVNLAGALRVVLYTVASGLTYIAAREFYAAISSNLSMYSPTYPLADAMVKTLTGLIGGLGLAVSSKLLTGVPLRLEDELGAAILGGVLAHVFFLLFWIPPLPLGYALAFAAWQIPVGWYLSARLREGLATRPPAPAA